MPMKYQHYHYQDFLTDDEFITWVLSPDAASDTFWGEFLVRYPAQQPVVEKARRAVLKVSESATATASEEEMAEIWGGIRRNVTIRQAVRSRNRVRWGAGIAASLLLLLVAFPVLKKRAVEKETAFLSDGFEKQTIHIRNDAHVVLHHRLPDSSLVVLQPGSAVQYAAGFSGALREVLLEGEGYFNVTKQPERAFQVFSQDLVVSVLGTSFSVKNNAGNLSVEVETGSVSVYRQDGQAGSSTAVVLGANEKVDLAAGSTELKKSIVTEPMPVLSDLELHTFAFDNEPVAVIFEALERVYGIEIVYPATIMSGCRLTTSLSNETLFEKLDVICAALGASYRVDGTRVRLDGKKCR